MLAEAPSGASERGASAHRQVHDSHLPLSPSLVNTDTCRPQTLGRPAVTAGGETEGERSRASAGGARGGGGGGGGRARVSPRQRKLAHGHQEQQHPHLVRAPPTIFFCSGACRRSMPRAAMNLGGWGRKGLDGTALLGTFKSPRVRRRSPSACSGDGSLKKDRALGPTTTLRSPTSASPWWRSRTTFIYVISEHADGERPRVLWPRSE